MANLTDLALYSNQLTGSIPAEIGNMTKLEHLGLFSNQLTGSIPIEIGNLTNLKYLTMYSNQLTGSIPVELGNLINLKNLWLDSNQLTGSIPVELGNLPNITSLQLNDNYLNGEIPTEIENLTMLTDNNGLKLETNCNLYSNDLGTQSFIVLKSRELVSYEDFLLTQGNCQPETPNTCPMNDINLNSTIFGTWDGDCDSSHRSGSYAKFYTFTLVNTKTVTITLESDFDTFLYLLPGTNQSSTPLAFNDDYNVENYNSQIIAELAVGTYTIEATTYSPYVLADFNLSLSENSDMPPAIIMYLLN